MQNNVSCPTTIKEEKVCLEPKYFYTASDISRMLYVSRSKAYREIRKLNEELTALGYVCVAARCL